MTTGGFGPPFFFPAVKLSRSPLLHGALALLLAVACQRSDPGGARGAAPGAAPVPELTAAEPDVREQIERARGRLSRAVGGGASAPERAAAWGDLARLYHAYEFTEAAAACYARARELAPEESRWAYLAGVLAQQQGDLEAAERLLSAAIELAPGDPAATLRLAEVRSLRGDGEGGRKLLESLLESPQYEAAARFALGHRAVGAGQPEAAIDDLLRVLELQPEATSVYPLLARALHAAGRPREALAASAQGGRGEVRRPDPLWAEVARLRLGAASHLDAAGRAAADGRLPEAERAYRRALAAEPESMEARQGLAGVLAARGEFAEARRLLGEVLARSPSAADARLLLADVERRTGDAQAAVAEYRRVLAERPELTAARLALGGALVESGEPGAALTEYQRVLDGSPDLAGARLGRASALAALGRRGEARRALEELFTDHPEGAQARLAHAILLAEDGLAARAEAEFRALLDSGAEPGLRARAAHNLGNLAAQARAWGEARPLFERALELDPDLLPARIALGTVLLETGDPARAAAEFRTVADRRPDSLPPRLYELRALAAAGRLDDARARLAAARERFGEDARIEALAARLESDPR